MDSISPVDFLDADPRPTCVLDLELLAAEEDIAPSIALRNTALRDTPHLLRNLLDHDGKDGARVELRAWATGASQSFAETYLVESLDRHCIYGYTIARRWRVIQWQPLHHSADPALNGAIAGQGVSQRTSKPRASSTTHDARLATPTEETASVIEPAARCRDTETLWTELINVLASPSHGCRFAVAYSLENRAEGYHRHVASLDPLGTAQYRLASAKGYQAAGLSLPALLNFATDEGRFATACRRMLTREEPTMLSDEEVRALHGEAGGDDLSRLSLMTSEAILCPIRSRDTEQAIGFLIVGLECNTTCGGLATTCLKCISLLASDRLSYTTAVAEATTATHNLANERGVHPNALADRNDASEKLASVAAVMEMVDVGFYEYELGGKLIQGNDAFYKLSGHPRVIEGTEMRAYSWVDCIFDEDKDWIFTHWVELTQGIATTFEMRWKRPAISMPDGKEDLEGQWVLAACVPTRDKDGVISTISGCITDIAAQKRSQRDAVQRAEALERANASEKRFGRFCEYANVAISIISLELQMLYCNREWFAIVGHPVVEFDAVDWSTCMYPEDINYIKSCCDVVLETKQAIKFQFRLRRIWTNGQGGTGPAWIMACAYPEVDDDGSVTAIGATLIDISYLKWAENVQKQRTHEAVEAKRQQENFIDFTCHEVRNPLSAVIHCADLIESALTGLAEVIGPAKSTLPIAQRKKFDELYGDIAEAVNTIMSCSSHQKRIMDDILTLSKLDSKLLTISPAPVRLQGILRDAEKMFEVDAKKAGITLRAFEDAASIPGLGWAMLDAGRLMQVLINLITNALKFTQNEAVRTVNISMRRSRHRLSEHELSVDFVPMSKVQRRGSQLTTDWGSGEEVYLYFIVQDTGCGFGDEQKTTVFERFAQASPRTHSKYGGSGLGLFITRELIELQGGEIGVRSRPGQGATFAFYITVRAADAPQTNGESVSKERLIHAKGDTPAPIYDILVVEDNLVNQKVMRKQLEKLGHIVHVASHGGEALAFLATTSAWSTNPASLIHVSVVLMDIEMPVMDGITCARKIREAQAQGEITERLPIIAVSANARYEQVSQAIEAGMDDAIAKPFRIAELVPKIERLVETARATEVG